MTYYLLLSIVQVYVNMASLACNEAPYICVQISLNDSAAVMFEPISGTTLASLMYDCVGKYIISIYKQGSEPVVAGRLGLPYMKWAFKNHRQPGKIIILNKSVWLLFQILSW